MNLSLLAILIAGSPALGLEALLIGVGGKLPSIYRQKSSFLKFILSGGIIIIGTIVILDLLLTLEPIYLCALIFVVTIGTGKIIGSITGGETKNKQASDRKKISDDEIKSMLERRGLNQLIKKDDKDSSES